MATIMRCGKSDTETDVDAGAHEEELEHKIVDGLDEELPIGGAFRRVLPVSAEVTHSVL